MSLDEMPSMGLSTLSTDRLVESFVEIALEQDKARLANQIARFNHLFDRMEAVEEDLKARQGDQRRTLLRL
jgi:hypothetical protein